VATWVIVGCGYVGNALARRLVDEHHDVIVTRRELFAAVTSARAIGPDVRGIAIDLATPATLVAAIPEQAIVVCLAPPGRDPRGELEALLTASREARRFVYVSSTGVYASAAGEVVDETWPVQPITETGKARVLAESAVANAPISSIVLRVAGIYGPARGLVDRIRAGTYRIIGDGTSHVSRIHVSDLVTAIVRAGTSAVTGAVNIADDDPAPIGQVADTLAARLGRPPPPRVPAESVDREVAGMLTADRRIANRRMKQELGVVLQYPSWRSGLTDGG
jgi:nucleoside-diphosphate-sugar epimerase